MITKHDLQEAIAECERVKNPGANTCIKMAAFYTLLDHIYDEPKDEPLTYSASPTYSSDSEFSKMIQGKSADDIYAVIDELMDALYVLNPKLYNSFITRLREL